MRKLFIFGIGGTGSRVIRSLQMLLAANAGKFKTVTSDGVINETEIFPVIIDYDVKNGDKTRAINALEKYSKLHKAIYSGVNFNKLHPEEGFFSTKVKEMKDVLNGGKSTYNLQYTPSPDSKKYSDSIGYDTMIGELNATQHLLELLYNDSLEQEFAELHIDTTVGFRGNPNIGSVMLNDIENTDEFKEFLRLCDCNNDDRVVIIGSLFGGTGSSGIPVLVNTIRSNDRTAVKNVKISTVLVCPYFKIAAPKSEDRHKGVIDDKIFESKTKAALHYYKQSLFYDEERKTKKIDSVYYVGDTTKSDVDHNIGEEEQKNPAHITELVSALSLLHFFSMPEGEFPKDKVTEWKYGFNVNIDGGIDATESNLDFKAFADENIDDIRKMVAYVVANRVVNELILTNNSESKDKNYYVLSGLKKSEAEMNPNEKKFYDTLKLFQDFYYEFKEWIKELNMGSGHRLTAFDFDSKEICDVTIGHEFRKETTTVFGKKVLKPTLKPEDDVLGKMSGDYKAEHQVEGKIDGSIQEGETITYAFFRSLYTACQQAIKEKFIL